MAYLSGKDGEAQFDGEALCITKWDMNWDVKELDVTCTSDAGHRNIIPGIDSAKGSFDGNWDTDKKLTDAPPDIFPGKKGTVKLFLTSPSAASVQFFEVPIMVNTVDVNSEVDGLVKYKVSWMSYGEVKKP